MKLRVSRLSDTYREGHFLKRSPVTIDPEGDERLLCAQALGNPNAIEDEDRHLLLCYGDHSLPDQRRGDAVYVVERLKNGSLIRHTDPALAYPLRFGHGFGVGASGWKTERTSMWGFKFFAAAPLVYGPGGATHVAWAMSRDGIHWTMLGIDGWPTTDPNLARRILRVERGESRFGHPATYSDDDGWLYLFTGYHRRGFTMHLYRFRFDRRTLFGVSRRSPVIERWEPMAGGFRRITGSISDEEDRRYKEFGVFPDALDAMDALVVKDREGRRALLVLYVSDRCSMLSGLYAYRISSTITPPYEWSERKFIDVEEIDMTALLRINAGGAYMGLYQDGLQDDGLPRLRGFAALAHRRCSAKPQGQPAGLYPIDLEVTA